MVTWCMAHPWMTFFILLSVIWGIVDIVKYIAHYHEDDEDESNNDKYKSTIDLSENFETTNGHKPYKDVSRPPSPSGSIKQESK